MRALKMQDVTLLRYHDAVADFREWAQSRQLSLVGLKRADTAMCEYFKALREDSRPPSDASYCLFGWVCLVCDSSGPERFLMTRARAALSGWQKRSPSGTRTGISIDLLHVFATEFANMGELDAGRCLEIQLDGYLRPSEAIHLQGRDIFKIPESGGFGLVIGNEEFGETTKAGCTDDTILLDSVDRSFVNRIMTAAVKGKLGKQKRLFPDLTLAKYESLFRQVSKKLGLVRFRISPHVVRHSGPSWDALRKLRSFEEIQARGRWACLKSVARYRKPGRLLLEDAKLDKSVRKLMLKGRHQMLAALL